MAKRKSKKPQEDTSILLESSVSQSRRRINSYTPALLLIIIFTVGASIMGWFCVQQQHSLDQLSESFTTMQKKITNLQQVMEMTDVQTDTGSNMEDRIFALEEAQKQTQEKAEVAQATSENLKNSNQVSELWTLHNQMETRLTEMKQVALYVTTLQTTFKNQSEELEAVKESIVGGLSSGSALSENVAELTNVVAGACSRVDGQVASVEALHAQLEGQASDLKESMYLHHVALYTNNQKIAAIKELVEAQQAMRAQVLEEMLSSVQMTLDEQFSTSQTLRSSVMAQLQTLHSQLANAPSWSMKLKSSEGLAAEEIISSTAQDATEVQEKIEDVEEEDVQQDAEDEAEEVEEEEAMQEEQTLEQEAEGGVIEEQEEEAVTEEEEEMTPEEQEDEEITEQSEEEEEEVAEETAEEEDAEELDESVEEVAPLEAVESSAEEESAELNSEAFMDENEEDG